MARRLCLGQDDVPRLPAHRGPELGVYRIDVQIARPIRAGFDSSELDPSLGQPSSQMGDEIGHRPVGVAVVAGPDDVSGIERPDQLKQLVPSGPLGLDLGVEWVAVRSGRFNERSGPTSSRSMGLAIAAGPQAGTGWRCET